MATYNKWITVEDGCELPDDWEDVNYGKRNKELLLKDLCTRLPYKVKVQMADGAIENLQNVNVSTFICNGLRGLPKPYLFPLSSMTDEMLEELNANGFFKYRDTIANVSHLDSHNGISEEIYTYNDIENISFLIEYFHSHHIDYRDLIPKELAIDATNLNIY